MLMAGSYHISSLSAQQQPHPDQPARQQAHISLCL
jgi:hypothetical protein